MSNNHKLHKSLAALSMLSQLGLSIAMPILLCIFAAGWLARRFALGDWVILAGILIGTGSGFCSLISFIRRIRRNINEEKEEKK